MQLPSDSQAVMTGFLLTEIKEAVQEVAKEFIYETGSEDAFNKSIDRQLKPGGSLWRFIADRMLLLGAQPEQLVWSFFDGVLFVSANGRSDYGLTGHIDINIVPPEK